MAKKDDECVELKNIKYQTMLMNKTKQREDTKNHTTNIENFLKKESMQTSKKPWNKLEKSIKRKKLSKFVVKKGSIAMDGISLTVVDIKNRLAYVSLIPHTIEVTNFKTKKIGDKVNIETDILGKYILK